MSLTRRGIVGRAGVTALAARLLAACGPRTSPPRRAVGVPDPVTVRYGEDPSQRADLHLPMPAESGRPPAGGAGRLLPVAVVIHGGFWRAAYDYNLGTPLAIDLANRGWAVWNLEYRRVGNGGGWPATLTDVADGIDALSGVGQTAGGGRLDLNRVVSVGHSAGGHLAVWAAARPRLPAGAPGAGPRVHLRAAVSQAGVVDLANAAEHRLGGGAVVALLGGEPVDRPDRYRLASPVSLLPLPVPVALVHGEDDSTVPIAQSERFAHAAALLGSPVEFTRLPGVGHYELINPATPAWVACRSHLDRYR